MNTNASTSAGQVSNNESNGSDMQSSEIVERHSEFFFDDTLVAIQIENTLFNIHRYQLLKSEAFSDMFKVPRVTDGKPEEGSSPEHPIKMEGIKASDFAALLKVLYAGQFSTPQLEPEPSLMIPAFRLVNMWGFSDIRTTLLPLAEKHLSDIDKIIFAKEFSIDDWLAPAHIRLCRRQEPLTTEEARKLGVDSVLLIARMREINAPMRRSLAPGDYCFGCCGFSNSSSGAGTGNSSKVCGGCHSRVYNSVHYHGVGTIMTGIQQDPSLEDEVKKWVEDGCMFKD